MKRHNEQQKMELRLKGEERKAGQLQQKGETERTEMERLSKLKFRIHLAFILKAPAKYSSFSVYLHIPLSEGEIRDRMMKGFGDI